MDKKTHDGMLRVLGDLAEERRRQVERYGLNRENPDGTGPETAWLLPLAGEPAEVIEKVFRQDYEDWEAETENGPVTWVHLIREEVAEAFTETDPDRLRAELLQVAALCVSWIENIDYRQEAGTAPALFGLDDFKEA